MTAVHRPLSDWVVRVGPSSSGTNLINDGDERADARNLPVFAEGWVRRRLTAGPEHTPVLALYNPVSSLTYAELDDDGAPLPLDESGTELIDQIETSWPHPEFGPADLAAMATLSRQIRYLLLHRLSQEGSPAPEVYHSLPWEPVAELASAVVRMLDGAQPSPLSDKALDLGHWVTPAAVGVTGPLEQLYEGLADPDPVLAARGGTALCTGLSSADPARFPAPVRDILADVARRLASVNPFLRHAASMAADRLTGVASTALITALDSDLPKAAAGTDDRTAVRRLGDSGPLSVRAEVTASGRLKITVELSVEATPERSRLLDSYGYAFAPVVVSAGDLRRRYWVALEARRRWLSGTLDVPAEHGRFEVGAQEAVTGVWGLSGVSPDELLVSLAGADRAGLQVWRAAAERVPTGSPLRQAVRRHDGRRGTS
ncbi:hypothetical protein ACFYR2_05895 [Streptomyces microflavus]|uniref:hypothetical protein n=1 Tax=Streptomyces microflavus TaxID=1919 RepID=UPI0036914F94